MYNFDDLGKKISELNEYTNALIAKTGLSYSEFAVLYTLAKDGCSTQKKIGEEWRSYQNKRSLTSARIFAKKD